MNPVELIPVQGSLVLRARGSELLILPQYIYELKKLKAPKEFAGFFMHHALINRPARKLFEAWLRKDKTLWKRTYDIVMNEIELDEETLKAIESAEDAPVEEKKVEKAKEEKPAEKLEEKPAKKKAAKKAAKKTAEKKPAKKKAAKKTAEKKPAKKKAAKKAATKTAKKKTATKAATKTAKKKTAKKASKK